MARHPRRDAGGAAAVRTSLRRISAFSLRALLLVALLGGAGLTSGCSNLRGAKLLAPETFGFVPAGERIYVESGADEETVVAVQRAVSDAESAVRTAYGSVVSHPTVNACVTEACYRAFGGMGSRAKVYGDRILLSPRGLDSHFLAHEWSHAEMFARLTLSAWWHMPQWFDEGLAVAVSDAPEHSEAHWQSLVAMDVPRPSHEELTGLKSLRQWLDAVHRYGETQNAERRARGEPEVRPVYAAAGHEVRPWLRAAGPAGLLDLIARLNEGEAFDTAYGEIGRPVAAAGAQ